MAPNLTKQEKKNPKIQEILLNVALKHQKSINQSINPFRGKKNNLPS
jgi:hypothetical protein